MAGKWVGLTYQGDDTDETVTGTIKSETFLGRGGIDKFYGLGGNDELNGDAGNDTLDGGLGDDKLNGGANDDFLKGDDGNDYILAGDGNDAILGGNGDDEIHLGYFEGADTDVGSGGAGDDRILGGAGRDTLNGNDGNDTLELRYSYRDVADTFNGGAGTDTLFVYTSTHSEAQSITVTLGATTIVKWDNVTIASGTLIERLDIELDGDVSQFITGGALADEVKTDEGNDSINTLGGDDKIDAGEGGDTIDAGAGSDRVALVAGGLDKVNMSTGDDHLSLESWNSFFDPDPPQPGTGKHLGGSGTDTLELDFFAYDSDDRISFDGVKLRAGAAVVAEFAEFESLDFQGASGGSVVTGLLGDDKIHASSDEADDFLYGRSGNDNLSGYKGANTLDGGYGNDLLEIVLDAKKDVIIGGAGVLDKLSLGQKHHSELPSPYTMSGNLSTGAMIKSGAVTLATITGIEAIEMTGTPKGDVLLGGTGADSIHELGAGSDSVSTGSGDDSVEMSLDGFADTVSLGTGSDSLRVATTLAGGIVMRGSSLASFGFEVAGVRKATVTGADQISISGSAGNDVFFGGALDDGLYAGAGANVLTGNDGADWLSVAVDAKRDILSGGLGDDTLGLNGLESAAGFTMVVTGAVVDVKVGGVVVVHSTSMEKVYANGSAMADTLRGLALSDTLRGYDGNDALVGGVGDDDLTGGLGVDTILGGTGIDTSYYYETGDIVLTMNGDTLVNSRVNGVNADRYSGVEIFYSGGGDDILTGDARANTFSGGDGFDRLDGGAGLDTASYGDQFYGIVVTLSGAIAVNVTLTNYASTVEDTIKNFENVIGTNYDDVIVGDRFANALSGGYDDDTLSGGGGNDRLAGDNGNDTLTGGLGADTFVFDYPASFYMDTVTDFSVADDEFELNRAEFGNLAGDRLAATAFHRGVAAHDLSDRIIYDSVSGNLFFDADGTGNSSAIQIAVLDTGLNLAASHFDLA